MKKFDFVEMNAILATIMIMALVLKMSIQGIV